MKTFCALLLASSALFAGDAFYLGTWKIDSAALAPWADAMHKDDAAEMKTLVGKTVVIAAKEITGPRQVACKRPEYKVQEVPAEGLYQGAFDEMRRKDAKADPQTLAEKVGFKGRTSKSLETGCGNELDFHFIDQNTATFGLNNYVYYLKRR